MAADRSPYELAQEILGLARTLVLELGGGDASALQEEPAGEAPADLDLAAAVEGAAPAAAAAETAAPETAAAETAPAKPARRRAAAASPKELVGASPSWAPRSWN
jgi:hypothetical protein